MNIFINQDRTLADIAFEFNHYFPFLKIGFFKYPHAWLETSYLKDAIPLTNTVGNVCDLRKNVIIEFHYWQKTGTVEKIFKDKAGLNVQIFRKQGYQWIQTNGTDVLSLEEQNQIGKIYTEDLLHGNNTSIEIEKKL